MLRKIIKIDQTKCNGCGACASACHEGAIEMVNGKAQLTREDYCDGFGDCLPACPVDAITFEMREAPAYNEEAVLASKAKKSFVCPGSRVKAINKKEVSCEPIIKCVSELTSWPVQIKLVPVNAPYFNGAKLLVAADCTAFAYASIHQDFIKDHITLIGCPKLDNIDYAEKLTQIIKNNNIVNISVLRMEVPCCGGLENAVKRALKESGKVIPWSVTIVTTDGSLIK
ncbi:ATP-binding protein [Bullifex porci]|uniref:Ferredoxin n=1 Tax=Bullifex porci TaxID=2606638 RepID=A0A7X2TQC1_9SPIO|nr:4Fe-4S binding protein [Bullifex porci]MDD7255659.1 4Fe-4S binding protein [Bullifex porci]MDY2742140.1 4Fe-4S binding protein [Bullifex porci]MSU06336.1 ferredoxin [Bullifex porci]